MLSHWKSKRDDTADVLIVGDSITDGGMASYVSPTDYGGSNKEGIMNYSYAGLLRRYLKNRYGDRGLGLIPSGHPSNNHSYITFDSNWTYTYTTGTNMESKLCNTSGATATIPFIGTGLELFTILMSTGGKFTVSIDGSTPEEHTCEGTNQTLNVLQFTGLTNGPHTCTITLTENKYVYLTGMREIKGTKGVRVNLASRGGASATTATATTTLQCIDYIQPDLTIISLGCNDHQQQIPLATFRTNLQTLINKGKEHGDVVITTIGSNPANLTIPYENYADIIRELAEINNIPLADVDAEFGGPQGALDKGYLISTSNPHPLPTAHMRMFIKILTAMETPIKFLPPNMYFFD